MADVVAPPTMSGPSSLWATLTAMEGCVATEVNFDVAENAPPVDVPPSDLSVDELKPDWAE